MPHLTGRNTYKGYKSPETSGWPEPIRTEVRHVYGSWRQKHPGESHETKSRGARIAWATARKKFPALYRRHIAQVRKGTAMEHKEHPEFSRGTAKRIALDHIREDPSAYSRPVDDAKKTLKPAHIHPAKTPAGRRKQVRDLRESSRQQRRWSQTAHNEQVSEERRSHKKKQAGFPIESKDLHKDARLAGDFAKYRKRKADFYDLEADRIAAIKEG